MKYVNHITREELDTINRIRDDCSKLHIMQPPACFLSYEVKDADGNIIEGHNMLSKSWVRNFYNFMLQNLIGIPANYNGTVIDDAYGPGKVGLKNWIGIASIGTAMTSHTAPGVVTMGALSSVLGSSNDNQVGIIIGSSNAAESFEDYQLGSILASGIGAGQMSYQPQSLATLTYDAGTKKYTGVHSRIFNNNTGAAIDIKEVGWSWALAMASNDPHSKFLVSRDVLPSTVTVPPSGQLTVTYTLEQIFPA